MTWATVIDQILFCYYSQRMKLKKRWEDYKLKKLPGRWGSSINMQIRKLINCWVYQGVPRIWSPTSQSRHPTSQQNFWAGAGRASNSFGTIQALWLGETRKWCSSEGCVLYQTCRWASSLDALHNVQSSWSQWVLQIIRDLKNCVTRQLLWGYS